ncbi:hypothetical protein [Flavobacterium aurantiibacter]|uniref:Flagellar assembly protein T N-terminal domain-containing protein n=1 Tax=Flavobacterium aurantiibacter TaxID=2023067 RepID=A0A255ZYA8_9FLAO|nr:hypothetical protein [Flavobacterium aurantiibacter]OYQ46392.1 hypothetical protein CHX27_04630 [Flavobacterium aurantiibacter]
MNNSILAKIKFLLFIFISTAAFSQQAVEAKGSGLNKADALQDALRNAVSQAVGVSLRSETRVENFMVISDAIASNTSGYIKKYSVTKEVPFPDRFEVTVQAEVTTNSLEADFKLLSKTIGGVRFLVMVDPSVQNETEKKDLQIAVDRINSFLAERSYRYVDQSRLKTLQTERSNLLQESNAQLSYAQQLAVLSNAQFIILVSQLTTSEVKGAFDISQGKKVSFQARAFDNCTGEGLGSISLESLPKAGNSSNTVQALNQAVDLNFSKLIAMVTGYIGSWVNSGTPYEIRFYNSGTFRDLRTLRTKLKADKNFGGDLEIVSANNYTKLVCTYKNHADDLADKILDYADEIPALQKQLIDVKMIYGRQINFAPQSFIIPNLLKPAQQ